jgi:hypothetical protein
MPHTPDARIAVTLLAVLITAAGAPIARCAAMPDCPAMTPATSCHGTSGGERHCAPARFEASDDCCTTAVEQSLPAAIEKLSAAAGTELPVAAGAAPSLPPPARSSIAALGARPPAPSGRALLSLHHTLLI